LSVLQHLYIIVRKIKRLTLFLTLFRPPRKLSIERVQDNADPTAQSGADIHEVTGYVIPVMVGLAGSQEVVAVLLLIQEVVAE
jgi:hypothetical protein